MHLTQHSLHNLAAAHTAHTHTHVYLSHSQLCAVQCIQELHPVRGKGGKRGREDVREGEEKGIGKVRGRKRGGQSKTLHLQRSPQSLQDQCL